MASQLKSALIVPVFNESSRWNSQYWIKLKSVGISLFFVNDGSTDNTAQLISAIDGAVVLTLTKNVGKAEAVRIGMRQAASPDYDFDLVGFIDADGAFEVSEVQSLIQKSNSYFESGFNAVWSSRVKLAGRSINRSLVRHAIGRVIGSLLAFSYRSFPYDSQSGFKIYQRDEYFFDSLAYTSRTRWFFELEHFANYFECRNKLLRIWEEPLNSWSEIPGSKIYRLSSIRILRELITIFKKLKTLDLEVNSLDANL